MSPEERAELERQLAAELSEVALDGADESDGDADACSGGDGEYVRLDLAAVLLETQATAARAEVHGGDDRAGGRAAWAQLLASVAFCEAEVFAAFASEMDELRSEILPRLAAAAESVALGRRATSGETGTTLEITGVAPAARDTMDRSVEAAEATSLRDASRSLGESPTLPTRHHLAPEAVPPSVASSSPHGAASGVPAIASAGNASRDLPAPLAPAPAPAPPRPAEERGRQEQTATAAAQEPAAAATLAAHRECARLKVHQRRQQELDAWMRAKDAELQREQLTRETKQLEAAGERVARLAMDAEDRAMRALVERQRQRSERHAMQAEDELARALDAEAVRATERQRCETASMAQEEAKTWRLVRLLRESERKEKLVEEQSRLRRWHHCAMVELVAVVTARDQAKRRAADAERRRAQREASEMRSEEHWTRRLLVHERMLREAQRRQAERQAMDEEHALAERIRQHERRQREEKQEANEREGVECEEQRSRDWETLWRLRMKSLRNWVGGEERRRLRRRLRRWKLVVDDVKQRDQEEAERSRRSEAASRIQHAVARYLAKQKVEEEEADARATHAEEAAQAARLVQSAFRGFHVRRKFQNALEMARSMESGDGDGEFGEVNLDELIEAPPELDDDWERRTMPVRWMSRPGPPQSEEEEDDEGPAIDSGEEEEEEDEEARGTTAVRADTPKRAMPTRSAPLAAAVEDEGGNLAAVLWNKMRRKSQKRHHAQEEKQKQKDPVYRMKKLLLMKTAPVAAHNNNQQSAQSSTVTTSVTWSTATDKKKAPKVNVPSLVERLRKKTAAAR